MTQTYAPSFRPPHARRVHNGGTSDALLDPKKTLSCKTVFAVVLHASYAVRCGPHSHTTRVLILVRVTQNERKSVVLEYL